MASDANSSNSGLNLFALLVPKRMEWYPAWSFRGRMENVLRVDQSTSDPGSTGQKLYFTRESDLTDLSQELFILVE